MKFLKVNRLNTATTSFDADLNELLGWESVSDTRVQSTVADIIERIKVQGDTALLQLTNQLDRTPFKTAAELEIPQQKLEEALGIISQKERDALQTAADRIRAYHQHQVQDSWRYEEPDGTVLGQQITPMDRIGIYVPGGKASYPSSVLMNAIPAKVAGVKEIVMTVPLPNGKVNPLVLAAAAIAGVDRVFAIGGAQAVAALALVVLI
jgi:histidinol dehydrogenase